MSGTDTNDLIATLLSMGAGMSKNKYGQIVAKLNGPVGVEVETDENGDLHVCIEGSSVNLTAHKHKIAKTEITLSPL